MAVVQDLKVRIIEQFAFKFKTVLERREKGITLDDLLDDSQV